MKPRWVDPHIRTSIAIAALILSITGLVLADRGSIWPASSGKSPLIIATAPSSQTHQPAAVATGTSVMFHNGNLHGRFASSHGRLLASGRRTFFTEVRVGANDTNDVAAARAPIAFVLVIDTSGSMAGQKIVDAKRSAQAMLEQMHEDDMVAVVRFSTDAQVVVPLQPVRYARASARAQIGRMHANGNTDIAGAVRAASNLLGINVDDRTKRIVVVTDGRDTSGAPRSTASFVARSQASRGVTVSALGIGIDYDDAYLGDLADAGRGNYEFLRDTSALSRFLDRELQETRRTTVRSVIVELALPPGVRTRDVWGANWHPAGDGNVRLEFGALYSGDERRALVTLEADVGSPGSSFAVEGTVSWVPVAGETMRLALAPVRIEAVARPEQVDDARDHSVLATLASMNASRREEEAARAFERGDRGAALQMNRQNLDELSRAAEKAPPQVAGRLRAQQNAYKQHRDVYESSPPSAAPARAIGAQERKNTARDLAY